MKQTDIDEKGKFLILKNRYKNCVELKNTWDRINDKRKTPSVIIYEGTKSDTINYDINPLGNIEIKKENEIGFKIEEIVKEYVVKQKQYEMIFGKSGYFKISIVISKKVAEKIYDLLLKYIK